MDVSGWTDSAAVEAWLLEQSRLPDDAIDLAQAALALAALAHPGADVAPYAAHLDDLAREGERASPTAPSSAADQVAALNELLFERAGYAGDRETYDDLANADLMRVIDRRKGLPIAVSILYIHLARGLGWEAAGVNFPGHFLVRLGSGDDALIVDPFERGAVRTPSDLDALLRRILGDEAVLAPEHLGLARNRDILLRLQNNIKLRCLRAGDLQGALAAIERMALVAPTNAFIWYEAAVVNAEIGQLRRARTCLDAMKQLDPERRLAAQAEALLERLSARFN